MPYKVKGQCIYKKEGGAKVGCTKGDVNKYLAALHANVDDINESNKLKGGKADKLTPEDIAKKFKITISRIHAQIRKGIKVEMEHTKDREKAKEIATDHISEFPDYYDRLKKMEKDASKKWETNEGIKKSLAAASLGLSLMGNPQMTKGSNITPMSQTQTQKVLAIVNFEAYQPISNPDLDLVHGALGSNRLQDDFEKRVEDELKNQVKNGNKPDVSNIQVRTYVQGDKIITKASCDIVQSVDGIAYTHFTTRGSIGFNYSQRHDNQINGLIDRLESHYGGVAKQVGDSIEISFKLNNNIIVYKQSFFVSSDDKNIANNQDTQQITGTDINNLRDKLNTETKDIYIDINSINADIKNYRLSYKSGNVKIYKISLLFDDSGNLDNRLKNIKSKNPTFTEIKRGRINNLDWAISIIPYEEITKETKTKNMNENTKSLIKRLLREELEEGKLGRMAGTLGMAAASMMPGQMNANPDREPIEYSKDEETKLGVTRNLDGSFTSTAITDGPNAELALKLAIDKAKNQVLKALDLDSDSGRVVKVSSLKKKLTKDDSGKILCKVTITVTVE
jgi:hypothetical protein